MTNTNDRADVAAERERFEAWVSDKHASKLLMGYAWQGWQARAAISSAVPDGGKGEAVGDGAANFACYLIDHCEGETISEENIQLWLGRMLCSPQYTAPQAEHVDGGKGEAVDIREELRQRGLDDHLLRIQRKEDGLKGNPDVDAAPQAERTLCIKCNVWVSPTDDCLICRAAPQAECAPRAPDEWKLVPHEPTKEMLEAGREQYHRVGTTKDAWQAMYCAAPSAIEQAVNKGAGND